MKNLILLLVGCLSAFTGFGQETPFVNGDLIVMFAPGGRPSDLVAKTSNFNGVATEMEMTRELSDGAGVYLFHFNHDVINQENFLRSIEKFPEVLAVQYNHYVEMRAVPSDPQFGSQWHHIDASDNDIDTDLAWNTTTGGNTGDGHNVVAAITEAGGINWAHPDLIANHWTNSHEIDGNGIDDDGNGRIDDFDGWNPTGNNDNIPSAAHGTACMGMLGAKANNGNGGSGVCWNTDLMAVSFTGSLTEANVIAAYDYPYDMRVQYNATNGALGAFVVVTSSSWGIDNANPASYPVWCAFYDTMGAAGIISVAATTNNNVNVDVVGDMPTGCSSQYLLSVTATNSSDVRTFAGYGVTRVDLGAPGEAVWIPNLTSYASQNGTSFATPCVAGAVALLYSLPCANFGAQGISTPGATALQIRTAILNGVDVVPNLIGYVATNGRLNVNNSMNLLAAQCGTFCAPESGYCDAAGYPNTVGPCAVSVCAGDSFCCTNSWDSICAGEAAANANCAYCLTPIGSFGCTNPNAANYNPSASCDDGTCLFCAPTSGYCDSYGYSSPGGACATAICAGDSFCCNVVWDSICASEASASIACAYCLTPIGPQGCTNSAAANYDSTALCDNGTCLFCAPTSGYCDFSGYYSPGGACATAICNFDSFCCNNSWDGICASEASASIACAYCLTPIGSPGCTNTSAANYDPAALCDDGTCQYCSPQPGYCDSYGYYSPGGACSTTICAFDSFCCNVVWDGICVSEAVASSLCNYCLTPIGALGCIDSNAYNYDSNALCDDGSCVYCSPQPGNCDYPYSTPNGTCATSVCVYDSYCCTVTWDGLCASEASSDPNCAYCITALVPSGCMSPAAANYDPAALCDDGSCLFCSPQPGYCDAPNFVDTYGDCSASVCVYDSFCCSVYWDIYCASEAAVDGNCWYCLTPLGYVGCTDPGATNYLYYATCDDGTCTYACPGDFDFNGVVNTSDLLLFMSQFGCTVGCGAYDMDANGAVNTGDLLLFMSVFGTICF